MAAYRWVYDSRHLQNPMLGNRVWATITFLLTFLLCQINYHVTCLGCFFVGFWWKWQLYLADM